MIIEIRLQITVAEEWTDRVYDAHEVARHAARRLNGLADDFIYRARAVPDPGIDEASIVSTEEWKLLGHTARRTSASRKVRIPDAGKPFRPWRNE